jgi:hypothetical protein
MKTCFLSLNLSVSDYLLPRLVTDILSLSSATTKYWSASQSAPLNVQTSSILDCCVLCTTFDPSVSFNQEFSCIYEFCDLVLLDFWTLSMYSIANITQRFGSWMCSILTWIGLWCILREVRWKELNSVT